MKKRRLACLRPFLLVSVLFLIFDIFTLRAYALPLTFFGEDISCDYLEIAPNSNDHVVIENDYKAEAARDVFYNYLDSTTKFEDFEGFSGSTVTGDFHKATENSTGLTVDFGQAGKAEISGDTMGLITRKDSIPGWKGTYPTSGDQYLGVLTNGIDAKLELTFEQAQSAFGFFATDFEIAPLMITFENLAGNKTVIEIPYAKAESSNTRTNNGSVFFWGIIEIDNPFVKVTFDTQSTWEGFGFDDFIIAKKEQIVDPVPEPGTVIYVGIGLLGLIAIVKKQIN